MFQKKCDSFPSPGKWKPSSQKATDKLECVSNNSNVKLFRIDLQNSSQVSLISWIPKVLMCIFFLDVINIYVIQ